MIELDAGTPAATPPYIVGPTFKGDYPLVECATWQEAVTAALALALEGRPVVVRDAHRHLLTTGRRLLAAHASYTLHTAS